MHSKFLFRAPGFQVHNEPLIQVLIPMIRMEDFDGNAKVCCAPGFILLVGFKSFGFQVKQVEVCQSEHVIGEGDVILASSFRFDRSRSPQV